MKPVWIILLGQALLKNGSTSNFLLNFIKKLFIFLIFGLWEKYLQNITHYLRAAGNNGLRTGEETRPNFLSGERGRYLTLSSPPNLSLLSHYPNSSFPPDQKKNQKNSKTRKRKINSSPFVSGIITHRQKQFHGSDSISIFPRPSAFLSFYCIGNGSLQGEAQVCGTREISQRLQGPRHASPRPHSGSCWSPVGRKLSPDRSRVRELLLFQLRALSLLMVLFNFLSLSNLASCV